MWATIKHYFEEIKGCYNAGRFWYCVKAFLQGSIRMRMFKNRVLKNWLSNYVINTYAERIIKANECYLNGKCTHCGCKTPDLFFANRACSAEEPCYDKMIPWWKRLINKKKK